MSDQISNALQAEMDFILQHKYGDMALLHEKATELLNLAVRQDNIYAITFSHTYLASYYANGKEMQKCYEHATLAEEWARKYEYTELLVELCLLCGLYYEALCDEQTALEYYLECVEHAEKIGNKMGLCRGLNNLGSVLMHLYEYDRAVLYLTKAYEVLKGMEFPQKTNFLAIVLCNLVSIYRQSNNLERAHFYLDLLLPCREGDESITKIIEMSMVEMYAAEGEGKLAAELAEHILSDNFRLKDNVFWEFELLLPLCQAMLDIQEWTHAQKYIAMAEKIAKGTEYYHFQEILQLKVRYYELTGQGEKLFATYQEYFGIMEQNRRAGYRTKVNNVFGKAVLREALKDKKAIEKQARELKNQVFVDALTGLSNRRGLDNLVQRAFETPEVAQLGLVMMDVDYFKEYNDFYGHMEGDDILREIAACMNLCRNEKIFPCRYGGDEFVCICYDLTDEEIIAYIEQVREVLQGKKLPHCKSKVEERITVSIGFYNEVKLEIGDVSDLFKKADQALYRAKLSGRNCYCIFGGGCCSEAFS